MRERLLHVLRLFMTAFMLVFSLNAGPGALALVAQAGASHCESDCLCDALNEHASEDPHASQDEHEEESDCVECADDCPDVCPDCDCETGLIFGLLPSRLAPVLSGSMSDRHAALEDVWIKAPPSRIFIPPISAA